MFYQQMKETHETNFRHALDRRCICFRPLLTLSVNALRRASLVKSCAHKLNPANDRQWPASRLPPTHPPLPSFTRPARSHLSVRLPVVAINYTECILSRSRIAHRSWVQVS